MQHHIKIFLLTLGTVSLLNLLFLISTLSTQTSSPSLDFDESGSVDFADFLLFVSTFGYREGQEGYEAKYDLDGNGEIAFSDFLIFVDNFGKVISSPLPPPPDNNPKLFSHQESFSQLPADRFVIREDFYSKATFGT